MILKLTNYKNETCSLALIILLLFSIEANEQIFSDLSDFVPDGPKIGFNCKKEQVPAARRSRKIIFESTVIIKKKYVLVTGETAFNLVCTRDKSTDKGNVVDVPDDKVKNIVKNFGGGVKKQTGSITSSIQTTVKIKQVDNVSTTEYPEEEVIDPDSDDQGGEKVCEDDTFCVDKNGNVIINGVNINEDSNSNGKPSRFDVTSPIIGARYGFICKRIQTPIIQGRDVPKSTDKLESTIKAEDGESIFNFVCKRDKSKDSGDINPRKKNSKNKN